MDELEPIASMPSEMSGEPVLGAPDPEEPEPTPAELPADGPTAARELLAVDEPDTPPADEDVVEVADPADDQVEPSTVEIAESIKQIQEQLLEGQRLLARQTEIAGNLHAENQTLRGGELRTAQSALVTSVLRVYDDVLQMAQTAQEPAARKDLEMVAEALADALARNGVDSLPVEPGDPFDSKVHKIAAVEPTDEALADRTVARLVRAGFGWIDGTLVRASEVVVFKLQDPPAETPPVADDTERPPPTS